jgi:hypothetical protein
VERGSAGRHDIRGVTFADVKSAGAEYVDGAGMVDGRTVSGAHGQTIQRGCVSSSKCSGRRLRATDSQHQRAAVTGATSPRVGRKGAFD